MPSTILIKKSSTASSIPTSTDLQVGELAVNTADKRIYTKHTDGSIQELGSVPSSLTTASATITSGTATNWTVTGTLTLEEPTSASDGATKSYVDAKVAALIDSAPDALDTLNELADAINNDADFYNKVLFKTGGTLTGDLNVGINKVVSTANPTTDDTLTRKGYVDSILGSATAAATSASQASTSATNAATSASQASTSATNAATSASQASTSASSASNSASTATTQASQAATSATNAATSATQAATSATNAENAWDSFDDKYLGAKASDPTVDNDGDALQTGALYFNTSTQALKVYTGSAWEQVYFGSTDVLLKSNNLSDIPNVATARDNLEVEKKTTHTTTAVSKTLVSREKCLVTASGQTITLPASPVTGTYVGIVVENFEDTVVARNGNTIMELAEDMTIDQAYASVDFVYIDSSWRLV